MPYRDSFPVLVVQVQRLVQQVFAHSTEGDTPPRDEYLDAVVTPKGEGAQQAALQLNGTLQKKLHQLSHVEHVQPGLHLLLHSALGEYGRSMRPGHRPGFRGCRDEGVLLVGAEARHPFFCGG